MFKVLLVEDNLIYRNVLKSALIKRFNDFEPREASGEFDALNEVDVFNPDLIIMDIDLASGINGLDLTKKIKFEHPEIDIIILSQHDIPEYREVAKQNGANDFFSKSTALENIYDYVGSVIVRKHEHTPREIN